MASPALAGTVQTTSNTTASTTYAGTYPTGVTAGELIIAHILVRSATTANTVTRPTGFTTINEYLAGAATSGGQLLSYWRAATGAETGAVNWTGTVSAVNIVSIFRLSGADTTTPVNGTPGTTVDGASQITHTFPAVTTTVADTLLVCIDGSSSALTFTSWGASLVQLWFSSTGSGQTTRLTAGASEAIPGTGSTGTRTLTTNSGITSLQSFAIAPGGGAPPAALPDIYYAPQQITLY